MPSWFALVELAAAALASAIWYLFPWRGAWPLLIGLAPRAVRLLRTGRPFPLTGFEVPLLVFLLTAAAAVWSAPDGEVAAAKFWLVVGGVVLFYAFVGIGDVASRDAFAQGSGIGSRIGLSGVEIGARVLAGLGAAVAMYFVATHDWEQFPVKVAALERLGRALQALLPALPGQPLNPTVAGGLLALSIPFTLGLLRVQLSRAAGRGRLAVAAGLLAIILVGLALTVDRGSWLALAALAGVAALWLALGRLAPQPGRRWRLLLAVLAVLMVGLLAAVWLRPGLLPAAMAQLPGGSTLGRLTLYRDGLALARDYPFIGAGLGSYMMLYSTYQLLIHVGFTPHADNLLIDLAIEQGVVAALALVSMWLAAAAGAGWLVSGGGEETVGRQGEGLWAGVALLALLALAVQGMVDDAFYSGGAVALLFVPLAFAVPALRRARLARRINLAAAGAIVAGALLVAALPALRAAWSANLGAVEQSRAELAVYSWPEWRLQDEVRRQLDLSRAIGHFEQALALDAGNFSANRRLGQIALSLGDYEAALEYLQRAYAAMPGDNATRQLYGEALIANGQLAEGARLWQTVNQEQGQLQARLFWYEYIGDEERLAAVRSALPR
jgi:hypothetical protein